MGIALVFTTSSCVSTMSAQGVYSTTDDNVVVVDDTCYVYYAHPTDVFLSTLHVIDGAYFYWHMGRYINVVFPYWEAWSPYRYFYYSHNHWSWRWRNGYNHLHHNNYHLHNNWNSFRHHNRPHTPMIDHRPRVNNHNHRPNVNPRPNTNHMSRPNIHHGQRSFEPRTNHQMSRPNFSQPRTMPQGRVMRTPSSSSMPRRR